MPCIPTTPANVFRGLGWLPPDVWTVMGLIPHLGGLPQRSKMDNDPTKKKNHGVYKFDTPTYVYIEA